MPAFAFYLLTMDLPPLSDTERFRFSRVTICDLCSFNCTYRSWLEDHADARATDAPAALTALHEAKRLYDCWDALRDSKSEFYSALVRRQALGRLRDLIGDEAYADARMPPHVPIWRFAERG